ncbi:MAG: UDP-N-acetylglucosamine 2-epimerase (non-hydrolyzing) [Bdellovibrionaceae bacterium]|nr:UDP-N-acetylglucosamine 2-epimerase (non-hydrolyzing) [Pseudobdellovibrionaceae bacterium]
MRLKSKASDKTKGPLKLLFSFGTRPEAIKLAPLIIQAKQKPWLNVTVVVTAQHREMLDQVLSAFGIVPDFDLNLMGKSQSLNEIMSRVLYELDKVVLIKNPDWVVVHGDTTTTLASTLAAFHRQVKVAHIEAGLRTYNMASPFPEEMNRQVVGRIAHLHLCPTERAKSNLVQEGIPESLILITGNTVIDALLSVAAKIAASPGLKAELEGLFHFLNPKNRMVLVTTHRRESFGEGLNQICAAISAIAQTRNDVEFVIPVHLNPNVKDVIHHQLGGIENIHLIEPQDYLPFSYLMMQSYVLLTDSGGIQEEAPALGKPVLVLRDTTERPEAIEAGCAKLVGTSQDKIKLSLLELLDNPDAYKKMSGSHNPFGDGTACEKILSYFLGLF